MELLSNRPTDPPLKFMYCKALSPDYEGFIIDYSY